MTQVGGGFCFTKLMGIKLSMERVIGLAAFRIKAFRPFPVSSAYKFLDHQFGFFFGCPNRDGILL